MSSERYWLARDGETHGPFSMPDLVSMWHERQLVSSDQLCPEGTENWAGAGEIMGLRPTNHNGSSNAKAAVTRRENPLKRFLTEEQDPVAVAKVVEKAQSLLTTGETIDFIGVQKKPILTISPDAVVLTNRRFMIVRPKLFGMTFEDFLWAQVEDVHLSEQMLGATIHCSVVGGTMVEINYLPKTQARRIYAYAQEVEEKMHHVRRDRDLEARRASAGGVVVHAPPLPSGPAATDPMQMLSKLKQMLDAGLIEQGEYDAKKAEVLSRM